MTDLCTRRRFIASYQRTKESHLGECSDEKLRTSTFLNDGTLRSTDDFASALCNINNVKIFDLFAFLVMLLFSSFYAYLKIICGGDLHF